MSNFIPTTDEVRYCFAKFKKAGLDDWDARSAEFDRWLSVVKGEAMQKGYEFGCEQGHRVGYNAGVYDFFTARQSND